MRQHRVGTLSLGVVLIFLGVFLLLNQINHQLNPNHQESYNLIVKFWPVVLFLLGGEVLWYASSNKENQNIKYDLFSIFLIFFLVIVSLGVYSVTQIGLLERLDKMVSTQHFTLQTPVEESLLDPSIEKIVIKAPNNLVIHTEPGDKLAVYGEAYVRADNMETAESLLQEKYTNTHKIGNTLYLSFQERVSGSDLSFQSHIEEFTLILPEDRQVMIEGNTHLNLMNPVIKNDWVIDNNFIPIEIQLPADANLEMKASIRHKEMLSGNISWEFTDEEERKQIAKAKLGEGKYSLYIISDAPIQVDQL